jgi:hypothetical protein
MGLIVAGGSLLIGRMQEQAVPWYFTEAQIPFLKLVKRIMVVGGLALAAFGLLTVLVGVD